MGYDLLLEKVGNFGRFQICMTVFCGLACIVPLMQNMATIFTLSVHPFECDYGDGVVIVNSCEERVGNVMVRCPNIITVKPGGSDGYSLRDKFGLYCSLHGYAETSNTCFAVGLAIGGLIAGWSADRFGRRPIGLLGCSFIAIGGMAAPYSPNFYIYTAFRVLVGLGIPGLYCSVFTVLLETISAEKRSAAYILTIQGWSSGILVTAIFGLIFDDFRNFELAMGICIVPVLIGVFVAPESPRWLYVMEKHEACLSAMRSIQKFNGLAEPSPLSEEEYNLMRLSEEDNSSELEEHASELAKNSLDKLSGKKKEEASTTAAATGTGDEVEVEPATCFDLIRFPFIGIATVITWYTWLGVAMSYYGWSLMVGSLGGDNKSVSLLVSGSMEIIGRFGVFWMAPRVGRKPFAFGLLSLAAILCLATAVLTYFDQGESALAMAIGMFGRSAISWSWDILGLIMAEFAPTPIRVLVSGSTSTMCRLGSIAGSLFPILHRAYPTVPYVVISATMLTSALACLMYPETLGTTLSDTLVEANDFIRINMPFTGGKSNKKIEMYLRYYVEDTGKRVYTLSMTDPEGKPTLSAHPAKFTPTDTYSRHRMTLKRRFNLHVTQQKAPPV